LWLVQGVDTAQAHIYHISNLPNPFKIKFLENLLAGSGGAEYPGLGLDTPGIPDTPDLAWRLRVLKV
jgi:hypothetical protein